MGGARSQQIINNLINGGTRLILAVIEEDQVALPHIAPIAVRGTQLCSLRLKTSLYQLTRMFALQLGGLIIEFSNDDLLTFDFFDFRSPKLNQHELL